MNTHPNNPETPQRGTSRKGLRGMARKALVNTIAAGLPHRWFDYRYIQRESVAAHRVRVGDSRGRIHYERIHPQSLAVNPLPANIASRESLPRDAGWWGYSFYDVPSRTSGETFRVTIPSCRVISYRDPEQENDFYPAILTDDLHALELREFRFRPPHAAALRQAGPPTVLKEATWIFERVYHNYAHWMTVHLPKLLLLKELNALDTVLMPAERTRSMNASLRQLGIDPDRFQQFHTGELFEIERLTLLGTDRFRPELLRLVQTAFGSQTAPPPHRAIYISREQATRRKLANEAAIWPLLQAAGFEKLNMEAIPFAQQVEIMRETRVLVAPHGAGLTNMMFCPPGAQVVEIADPAFPNPNFYALASAMGHTYFLIPSVSVGDGHPLDRNMRVEPAAIGEWLARG